jgi:hypothetical protein
MEFYSGHIDYKDVSEFYVYTDDRFLIAYGEKHLKIRYSRIEKSDVPLGSIVNVSMKGKKVTQAKIEDL